MENKTSKIIFAASGVIAIGATLYWVWKKFIDIDDDEEEAQVIIVFVFHDQAPEAEVKTEEVVDTRII